MDFARRQGRNFESPIRCTPHLSRTDSTYIGRRYLFVPSGATTAEQTLVRFNTIRANYCRHWLVDGGITLMVELKRALLGEMGRSNIEGLMQPEGVTVLR